MKILSILCAALFLHFDINAQGWNYNALEDINIERNVSLDHLFKGITNTASPMAFGIPVILYGTGLIGKNPAMKSKALYIGSTVLISSLATTILKNTIREQRPHTKYPDIQNIGGGGSYSFPSGHTSDAFALATSVSMAYPKWYIIAPSFLWASAVGYSRMYLGVHYPKDVIAGAIVGAGSALLSAKIYKWRYCKHPSAGKAFAAAINF